MSTGPHARRATELTVAEREESFTQTESVGGRCTRLREKLCCLIFFFSFFLTGARCSNQAGNYYTRGDGDFFFLSENSVSFSLFLRCCCAVLCVLFRTYEYRHRTYRKKKISTLSGVCTYVRHVSEHGGRNRPRCEAYVASELFSPEAWRRGTFGIIKSPVCNYNHKINYIQSWTSFRFAYFVALFLPERA